MKITIITIGSRGDVQPFVALGMGLRDAGHDVTICTSKMFASFVAEHGLHFAPMDADFLELMQSPDFRAGQSLGKNPMRLMSKVNDVIRGVLRDAWDGARESDAIIYHPKAMGGYHIAEKLGIPAFLSLPLPFMTPTAAFPIPIIPQTVRLGAAFNRFTYSALNRMITAPYQKIINQWRKESLGLPPRRFLSGEMTRGGQPVPVLYSYSRHVVPVPADWPDSVHVTGYWFLDDAPNWQPPAALLNFLDGGTSPVYIGFGSMIGTNPQALAQTVLAALKQSGQRGILASGWGGLSASDVPDNVYLLEAAPHDWLFPRTAAVVHHGGAGTTAAGLRAGKPTVIVPFLADQPFWGSRMEALGVGPAPIPQKRLTADNLASAIRTAVTDEGMRQRAADLGAKIRAENGVANAVEVIERTLKH
jgi:sterol 3beta-glucosyltransferase